jgi:hypothetical protein
MLRDVPDMETRLISMGKLDQFQFSLWQLDVSRRIGPELDSVTVSLSDLVNFRYRTNLTGRNHFDKVLMGELRCAHKTPSGMLADPVTDAADPIRPGINQASSSPSRQPRATI